MEVGCEPLVWMKIRSSAKGLNVLAEGIASKMLQQPMY